MCDSDLELPVGVDDESVWTEIAVHQSVAMHVTHPSKQLKCPPSHMISEGHVFSQPDHMVQRSAVLVKQVAEASSIGDGLAHTSTDAIDGVLDEAEGVHDIALRSDLADKLCLSPNSPDLTIFPEQLQ